MNNFTTITIDKTEDFIALKAYADENNYRELLPDSPALAKLKDKEYHNYLEFAFDTHEKFIITLSNEEKQQESCDWLKNFIPQPDKEEELIFGKDKTQRIVSCEAIDTGMELFIENEDGTVTSKVIPNEYWLLSNRRHDPNWKKLKNELFYKYIKKYGNKEEWLEERKKLKDRSFSVWNEKEAAMMVNGFTYFKGMNPQDVSVLSFDIESTTLEHTANSKVLIISNTFRNSQGTVRTIFCHDEYENQGDMLVAWCNWVRKMNPSVVLGHNIFGFDLPYLQFIADLEGVDLKLGRDKSPIKFDSYTSQFRKDGSQSYAYTKARIYGREIIDTMFLSYKYDIGRKYESYGLKPIIKAEGLEAADRQFYDSSKIRHNYTNSVEWEKIKAYCQHDSDDALKLFDLMVPAYFYITQSLPMSFQEVNCKATGSQINGFLIRSYLQHGHSIPAASNQEDYEGAISFGNHGIYRNVKKLDISSLYPSIILQYNVYDRFKDPSAHFYKMVKYFTRTRLEHKALGKETGDKRYKDMEQAEKIFINSAYGLLGSTGTHFNSPTNAAFITRKGREIITFSIEWATGKIANTLTFEQWLETKK